MAFPFPLNIKSHLDEFNGQSTSLVSTASGAFLLSTVKLQWKPLPSLAFNETTALAQQWFMLKTLPGKKHSDFIYMHLCNQVTQRNQATQVIGEQVYIYMKQI